PYPLTLATDPVANQQVYTASWFLSYPGNSGGPLYVQFNGYYYPAGVYLGTLFNGGMPYASAVRAIGSALAHLTRKAASSGDSGTNNSAGIIVFIPSQAITPANPGYLQMPLGPPSAVASGAAWRLQGDSGWSSSTDWTRSITSTAPVSVEFQ